MRNKRILASTVSVVAGVALLGGLGWIAAKKADAQCASCHVPPLYTEPGENLHSPAEMGIDSFQAERSPTLEHYDGHFKLGLSDQEKVELTEYLKSL